MQEEKLSDMLERSMLNEKEQNVNGTETAAGQEFILNTYPCVQRCKDWILIRFSRKKSDSNQPDEIQSILFSVFNNQNCYKMSKYFCFFLLNHNFSTEKLRNIVFSE